MSTCPNCGARLMPPKRPLTEKQAIVLNAIRTHITTVGYAPTLQQLADAHRNALSTMWAVVDELVKKGHVKKAARDWQAMEVIE